MPESESPFALRGVIEGFYGTFYTFPERNDMIDFIGKQGFNFYAYGPKNDRQHRMRWWDPYPPVILEEFAKTIRVAQDARVQFCYTISFGVPPSYATSEDFDVVTEKFRRFYDLGCRAFGILLDDAPTGFAHDANRRAFPTVAAAHADFCNRVLEWASKLPERCFLMMAPTDYYGASPFSDYLYDLGRLLDGEIQVCYTGRDICVPTLTAADAEAFGAVIRRKPLIWDNYPVNDLQMRPQLHLGPLEGRDPALSGVVSGMMFNPMIQAEASKIPLLTIADYLRDPGHYNPEQSWDQALRSIAGERGYRPMRIFAENCLGSCLHPEEAPRTDALAHAALLSIQRGEPADESEAVSALSSYLDELDEAIYQVRNRMPNVSLRQSVMPWVETLDEKLWLARRAVAAVRAEQGGDDVERAVAWLKESVDEVRADQHSVGGSELRALGEWVYDDLKEHQAAVAHPRDEAAPEMHGYGGAAFVADR